MPQSCDSPFGIDVSWDGPVLTVAVTGELDFVSAPDLGREMLKVAVEHPEQLVLELEHLVFVDAAGARVLDHALQGLDGGCPVIFRGLQPATRKLFLATGFLESMRDGPEHLTDITTIEETDATLLHGAIRRPATPRAQDS